MEIFLITVLMLHFSLSYSVTVEQFYPFGIENNDDLIFSFDGIFGPDDPINDRIFQLPFPITMLLENRGGEVSTISVSV